MTPRLTRVDDPLKPAAPPRCTTGNVAVGVERERYLRPSVSITMPGLTPCGRSSVNAADLAAGCSAQQVRSRQPYRKLPRTFRRSNAVPIELAATRGTWAGGTATWMRGAAATDVLGVTDGDLGAAGASATMRGSPDRGGVFGTVRETRRAGLAAPHRRVVHRGRGGGTIARVAGTTRSLAGVGRVAPSRTAHRSPLVFYPRPAGIGVSRLHTPVVSARSEALRGTELPAVIFTSKSHSNELGSEQRRSPMATSRLTLVLAFLSCFATTTVSADPVTFTYRIDVTERCSFEFCGSLSLSFPLTLSFDSTRTEVYPWLHVYGEPTFSAIPLESAPFPLGPDSGFVTIQEVQHNLDGTWRHQATASQQWYGRSPTGLFSYLNINLTGVQESLTSPPELSASSFAAFLGHGQYPQAFQYAYYAYVDGEETDRHNFTYTGFATLLDDTAPVPEPTSLVLLGSGLCTLVTRAWQRKRRQRPLPD